MQDRYVGDVGDFGKYGLLRALCARHGLRGDALSLGVIWYLVPDEESTNDGTHTGYLRQSERNLRDYRACDPDLYDGLGAIVSAGTRNVASVQESNILPRETSFYGSMLSFEKRSLTQERRSVRSRWLAGAIESVTRCELVFVDPDNGLQVGVGPLEGRGPKYVFFDELRPYCERRQSLVIYHHIGRRGSTTHQVQQRLGHIRDRLGREAFGLVFHRGSARVFFVAPAEHHRQALMEKARRFVEGPWGTHFDLRE